MTISGPPAKALREATHELNNLCSTIVGFATLAEEMELQNSALVAYLTEIRHAADGIAAIAKQLRAVSQELEGAAG